MDSTSEVPAGPSGISGPLPAFAFSPASLWAPLHIVESAWLEHAPFAFWLVDAIRPRNIVELGTHNGFSFLAFCQAVQRLGLSVPCYAVDTWQGDEHAGFYGEDVYAGLAGLIHGHYSGFAHMLRCRFDEALPYFSDGSIDLLHIDGRHTYEDARQDYETWLPRLSRHGVVLFHDTAVRERDFGVWRLWEELSSRHPAFSFHHGHGLGVLAPGGEVPEGLRSLLAASPRDGDAIRNAYARLGHAVSERHQLERVHHLLGQSHAERDRLQEEWEASVRNQEAEKQRLQEHLEASAQAHEAALQAVREELEASVRNQEAEKQRLQEHIAASAQAHEAALQEARAEAEAARAAARQEHERLMQLQAGARQDFTAQEAQLRASLAERTAEENRLRQAIAEQVQMAAALQGAIARLSAENEMSRAALAQLEGSTLWRATRPLRQGLSRVPLPMRNMLRRGAKAAWWAVTPHLMPQRMAFLRARRQTAALEPFPATAAPEVAVPLPAPDIHFSFQPLAGGGDAAQTADRNGKYELLSKPAGYTYVPPRRPPNLQHVIGALRTRPRFSIIVPTYNTPPDLLGRVVASVKAQWYPDWQLILIDDASPDPAMRERLRRLDDPRIQILLLDSNRGISGATNAGLENAEGDYVVFLDHDDELTEDCLYELALCIDREDADFIYSDEDKIDEQGRFVQPFFKPDWSPDTMMSTMFTCHVSCVRRSLLQEVGPLNPELDGSQDWDLVLRITEKAQRIRHIPKILYHWRIIPASVAADLSAKPYAVEAGRRAREAALARRGLAGRLEPVDEVFGYFRTRYEIQGNPLISVIIPTRDNGEVLSRCIQSLYTTSRWANFEIVVLDNGSQQPATLEILEQIAEAGSRVVRHDAPFNYSQLNNIGAQVARGEILLFLNDDTELLTEDALERMAAYAQLPHIGAVGAKLLYPSTRTVQHAGIINLASGPCHAFLNEPADSPGYFMRNLLEFNWSAITGACLMIERKKLELVGGFDEDFPVSYNDVDFCFRLLKQGLFHVVCPTARWLHHESLSRGLDHVSPEKLMRLQADRYRLFDVHPDLLMHDPFYNPNLHPDSVHFGLPA